VGTKYSNQTTSGYNASPPPDDGTTVAANQLTWATIKGKLSDPLNNFDTAINAALLNALDTSCSTVSGTYTTIASDNARTLQCSGTFTLSLGDASTLGAGWWCNIVNAGSGTITLGRATGGNTLAGVASNITLGPLQATTVIVNQAANGFNLTDCNSLIVDQTDITKQAKFDVSGMPTATVANLKIAAAQIVEGQQGVNIASAATVNLDTATGNYIHVTGTTTTTAITLTQGRERTVVADAAWPVTAGASLIMTGIIASGSTYTFSAGDVIKLRGEAAGVVRVVGVDLSSPAVQGSSLVLLSTQVASNSATLQFTTNITSLFDEYVFKYIAIVPATNSAGFLMNMSINGGSSYDSGGTSYSYANNVAGANATNYGTSSTGAANIVLNGVTNGLSNSSSGAGYNGESSLYVPSSTTNIKHVKTTAGYNGNLALATVDAMAAGISTGLTTSAVNAVSFQMSSGNITSGLIRMYGVRKQ
jgi:hypothetical protein